jgi:predicted short-subunit dehydrogenase-like oxidoreductase (DUF2520 family)
MGQVPGNKKILVIGNGRVAKHWLHYLSLLKIPTSHWYRKSNLELKETSFDLVFLAVSDSGLPELLLKYPWLQNSHLVHFSGANYFDGILGIHPLMTFSNELYDRGTYQKIALAIDFAEDKYKSLFSFLPNPTWQIEPSQKAKYHALCVMSGNFPQILWQKIETEITALGCPVDAWKVYILMSATNYYKDSNSLTGPLVRKDVSTIEKNVASLSSSPLQAIYKSFCQFYGIRGDA